MKFPNWFRLLWWAMLAIGLTAYFWLRLQSIQAGAGTTVDTLAFVLYAALLLLPVVSELELFGVITLKQQVDSLRAHVDREVSSLRNEIHTIVGVTSQVNPQFHISAPLPDSQLPQLQDAVRVAVQEVLRTHGLRESPTATGNITIQAIDEEVAYLFAARYQLEREINRVYNRATAGYVRPTRSAIQQAEVLRANGVIDTRLFEALREVYAVCSAAIHGLPVTPARVAFVRETAPGLLQALQAMSRDPGA